MLKKRITKWDLDRNHKHADMLCALRLAFQREAQGKKTVFLIRGRVVTFHDIKQYFRRRKEAHDLQSLMIGASTAMPTTCIDCRTPEPGATAGDRAIYNAKSPTAAKDLSLHHTNPTIIALPDSDQVDHMITLTGTLNQLDQLLRLGWNYYDSVFENPGWRSKDDVFELGSLEMFYHHMFDGQSLLERSRMTEAFEHFSRAFDLIHHLFSQQIFLFLPYLYHMMLPTRQIRRQEVFSQLLDFIPQMAEKCCPQLNPIQRSLTLLRHMSVEDRGESSKRVFQSILNRLRVGFEADIPDEFQLLSSVICQERANLTLERNLGSYKLTSVVVWELAKDAELLEYTPSEQKYGRYADLKPENILRFKNLEGINDAGVLQISDLSLGRFHRLESRSKQDPRTINGSPTYILPEFEDEEF